MSLLELEAITKSFGAIQALQDVDLSVSVGEAVGLMGDNGAGKSTLMKIVAGNYPPTGGSIRIEGEEVHFHKPIDARQHGIEIVYQDLALCDNLTAAANVFLGRERKKRFGPIRYPRPSVHVPARGRAVHRSSSPKPGRGTSCARCRAGSARRLRSRAPVSRTRSWC